MTALGRPLDFRYRSNRLVLILSSVTALGVALFLIPGEIFFPFGLISISIDRILGSFLIVFLTWALGREYDPDRPATANISAGIMAAAFTLSFPLSFADDWWIGAVWGQLPNLITLKAVAIVLGLMLIRSVIGSASPRTTMPDRIVIHVLVLIGVSALYLYGTSEYLPSREPNQAIGFYEYRGLLWFMFLGAGLVQLWLCYALWLSQGFPVLVSLFVRAIAATVLVYGLVVLIANLSGISGSLTEYARHIGEVAMIHLAALIVFIPWLLTLRTETIRSKSDDGGEQLDPQRVSAGRAMLPMVAVFSGTLFLLVIPVVAAVMRHRQPDPEPEMPKVKIAG